MTYLRQLVGKLNVDQVLDDTIELFLIFLGVNYYIWCSYRRISFLLADVLKGKES